MFVFYSDLPFSIPIVNLSSVSYLNFVSYDASKDHNEWVVLIILIFVSIFVILHIGFNFLT